MKKYILILITIYLIISSTFSVFATDTVSFELTDCNCNNNRLFTVDMVAQSDLKLSAATFEFTYDKSMFEFRSIKAVDEQSQISYNELDNGIKAVFLNAFGQDIKNNEVIFTLTFKSINSGMGNIDFSVSECVSPDIKFIDIGTCTSSTVTVNGNQTTENNHNSGESKSEKETTKSQQSKEEKETTANSTIDELGILNPVDDWNVRYFIIGICLGIGFIIIVLLIYFISRRIIRIIKSKNDESSD